ncbi:unnamed protein product, partial [Nesidiocoris tenuis]
LHIRPIFKTTDRTESTYASVQVAEQISAVRLERHVLNSSDPLLEGGRARPGQLRLSGEKPSPGTAVYFTLSCRTVVTNSAPTSLPTLRTRIFVSKWISRCIMAIRPFLRITITPKALLTYSENTNYPFLKIQGDFRFRRHFPKSNFKRFSVGLLEGKGTGNVRSPRSMTQTPPPGTKGRTVFESQAGPTQMRPLHCTHCTLNTHRAQRRSHWGGVTLGVTRRNTSDAISLQPCDSSLATLFTVEQYNLQRNDALICAEIYFSDANQAEREKSANVNRTQFERDRIFWSSIRIFSVLSHLNCVAKDRNTRQASGASKAFNNRVPEVEHHKRAKDSREKFRQNWPGKKIRALKKKMKFGANMRFSSLSGGITLQMTRPTADDDAPVDGIGGIVGLPRQLATAAT